MTDLDKFIDLYKSLGIDLNVHEHKLGYTIRLMGDKLYDEPYITESDKFDGYHGFYSEIKFDKDKKFISQGFWE